ncbi:MAG: hypothetical protein KBS57_04720 [Alistipes sp.]|nr:hypothetical protein [Candidatus Minthomonas equi]
MKKALFILLCLGVVFSAQAQFTQSGNSSKKNSGGANTVDVRGFNKIYAFYNPVTLRATGYRSENGNQLGVAYTRSQCLARFPLYLEFGGGFEFTSFSDSDLKLYSVNVPVNLTYRFSFSGGKLHLAPYTGPFFRFNVAGNLQGQTDIFHSGSIKKFQFGWQEGVAFSVSAFYVSLSYAHDFSKLADISASWKISGFHIGLGVVF